MRMLWVTVWEDQLELGRLGSRRTEKHNSPSVDQASELLNLEESLQWIDFVLNQSWLPEVRKTFLFSKLGKL